MTVNKKFFICAMLVLMLFLCINASSASEPLNEELGADIGDAVAVSDVSNEKLSASGDTYVVDANGGGQYTSISAAVSDATGGETILIKNGTYIIDSTINFEKSLNVVGESKDGVTIKSSMPSSELFLSTTAGTTLSFSNLIIKDSSKTGGTGFIRFGSDVNASFVDCTFQNITNKYGVMQLSTTGTVNIENCKFNDIKCSVSNGAAGIYTSAASTINIKNTIFDNGQFTASSGQVGGVIFMSSASSKLYMDTVTIQNFNGPANSVVRGNGIVDIRKSKIINNTVTLSASGYVGESLFYIPGSGQLIIEQTIIADNTIAKNVFYFASGASATVNYNNIYNNAHDSTYEAGYKTTAGTLNADYNYWGSDEVPSDVVTTNHVIKDASGNYVLNTTGEAVAKEIPELTDEGGDESATYDVYVSPDGNGDGSSYDTPTSLDNAFMYMMVPEGGSMFLLNGEYTLMQAWIIGQSMSLVGESRDGVILTGDNSGFLIGDPVDPTNEAYSVGSVSFSKMTIESSASDFIIVPASMTELTITDCIIEASSHFVSVGHGTMGPVADSTGTLNFKKNVVSGDDAVVVGGQWNANINNNLFLNSNSGESVVTVESAGEIDVDYNYWGSNTPATDLEIQNYIKFNANSNASEIYTDESAKITVKATLNDDTTSAASYLPNYPIEATLSAAGTLSQRDLELSNGFAQATYTSDVARSDNIGVTVLGQALTVPITVKERYTGIVYVNTTGSDDNEGSESAPVATVGKAVELALVNGGSGEIIINEGTYVGNGYHVTGDLTVTGQGKVTLDANNEGRFFYMAYGDRANKIELHNLILTNAKGEGQESYGVAVYSGANELILDNVTIVNTQTNGYLIKSNGKLTVKDSNITNSASGNVIEQSGSGDIIINNTVFENNNAFDSPSVYGIVYISSGSGNLVIEDSKFVNNSVRQSVIRGKENYNINVKGSSFINNTNDKVMDETQADGGVIYAKCNTLEVTDSVFINNKAAKDGGAIYVGSSTTANIDKSVFINNTANAASGGYHGDAIYNGNKLTVNNCVILTNANNKVIYNNGKANVVNAQNNWWGTNTTPKDLVASGTYEEEDDYGDYETVSCGEVDVSNWATMDASFVPEDAQAGEGVTVTAVFSNANLPDGINVTFTSTSGYLNTVVSTVGGEASTTYTIDATDEAITATSSNVAIEMPISIPVLNNIVTQTNFYDFFDADGVLLNSVTYDELIFEGDFTGLNVDIITVGRTLSIVGNDAVLYDMALSLQGVDSKVANVTFIVDGVNLELNSGAVVLAVADDIEVNNITVEYVAPGDVMAFAVYANSASNFKLINSTVVFEANNIDEAVSQHAVRVEESNNFIVKGNTINATLLPKVPDFYGNGIDKDYVLAVGIQSCENGNFTENEINMLTKPGEGWATIDTVMVDSSNNLEISWNNFTHYDPDGNALYAYAIDLYSSNDLVVKYNNEILNTTAGIDGSGTAYAVQATGPYSGLIVEYNNITSISNGPNLGFYSQNYGGATEVTIRNNLINITGLATSSSNWALVSGIELQDNVANVYNNTIYTQSIGEYADNNYIYGISYAQNLYNDHTYDIRDNTIYTEGKYAVYLLQANDATITGNTLYGHELTGDDAVLIESGDNNVVKDNLPKELTNIVTRDNFYSYFDAEGNLLDAITFDELIFQGEFADLARYIRLDRPITVTGDDAVLNDIGFIIAGDGVILNNMTLVANSDLGNLIDIVGENAVIKNMTITYVVDEAASAITVCPSANGVQILNNTIYFESTVDDYASDEVTTAICVNSGVSVFDDEDPIEGLVIDGNNITAVIPAFLMDVYENEYYVLGLSAVNGVRINGADKFKFTNNKLDVTTNRLDRTTPTLQALYVASSSGSIDGNNISMIDTFTPAGKDVYLYAVELINDEDLSISNNNFNLSTTGGKDEAGSAYAIFAIASEFEVTDNNITTVSNGPNIGIWFPSQMGAPCDAVISGNFINVTGLATSEHDAGLVSGIEIQTGTVEITGNTIYTYNIGEYAEDNYIYGISYAQDGSAPEVEITDNTIYTEGHYTISFLKVDDATITGNYLVSADLVGDDSVNIAEGTYTVEGNLPVPLSNIVINDTFFSYFDAEGNLLDTITFDELIFEGPFSDLTDVIVLNRAINVTTDDAVLNNIAIRIAADNVNLTGFTLTADKEFADNNGALIYATGANINISGVAVDYDAPSEAEAIAIYANAAENFTLVNSEIIFSGANPGSTHYRGLEVRNSDEAKIDNNTISAVLPAVPVAWGGEGIAQDLVLAVGIQGGNSVEFTNNRVTVNTNGGIGAYPTVDAVMIHSANDILIKGNNITHVDTTTEDSARYYYSLDLYSLTGAVEENNIIVNTTAGVDRAGTAYPIQLNGPSTVTVKNNNLTAVSKGPANGIYATNWMGAITLIVENNTINVTGYATTGNDALVSGIEAEIDVLKAYNNTIVVKNTADYNDANQVYGISMVSSYMSAAPSADIKDNNMTVDGKYTVYYASAVNTNVTGNTLYAHELDGDKAVYLPEGNVVKDNLPAPNFAEIIIDAESVWIGSNGTVSVTVPEATGTVTIEINGKSYPVDLENGAASKEILAEDLIAGENAITVTYEGPEFETTVATGVLYVADGVVTQDTYKYYFNQADSGKFYDYVPEGATLDFQGSIINPDQKVTIWLNVNKPVNIITTTKDAYVDLNTTAGSLMGENPGNRFTIGKDGSGTNVTGITFHNTQLWLTNTHNVVLDNISAIVEDQQIGSGVGATSIRDNSTYVTVKNSYFYTRNNGGSSSLVLAWADYCTWDNNTIKVSGNVGNMLYLNTFNVNIPSGVVANCHNVIKNNVIYGPEASSGICCGIVINGKDNLVENNTVYYKGMGIASPSGGTVDSVTYRGNKLYNGSSIGGFGAFKNCTFEDNYISGAATIGVDCKLYNNTFNGKLTINKANVVARGNTIKNTVTISESNITFENNNVTSTVTVSKNNNVIKGNNITVTGNYAVDLKSTTGNNVTDNYLVAAVYKGDAAVKHSNANNMVENNIPTINVDVVAESVWIGSNSNVVVTIPNATGSVTIKVNEKEYPAELDENGTAVKEIPAEDLVAGENSVTVSYNSAVYGLKKNSTTIFVLDGVVTQDTYLYYFNQEDNGKLFDYVPEGATLDFQGSIINPDQKIIVQMNVNKPVNIISTTGDAYVDLNTTAGTLLGESPGNSFAITRGGSGTNVTGIAFHNTQLWISNTTNVVLDNISNVIEDQRVGSGVGATSVRDNSTYVTIKNSYFYTRNNGGSTTNTFSHASYCTFDNNTVKIEGTVGNAFYLNPYNVADVPTAQVVNNYNNITNNRIYGKPGGGISQGIVIWGSYNLFENNTLYACSIAGAAVWGVTNPSCNNTFIGNDILNGGGLTAQPNSVIYDNNVTGALTTGTDSIVYNNTIGGKLTVSQDAKAYNNTVGNGATTGGTNAVIENNTITGAVTINKVGTTFVGNDVAGTVTVSANDNSIENNTIISTGNYAVDLGAKTGNNVTGNYLVANEKYGQDAVKSTNANNVIEDNRPYDPELVVSVENITVGEDALVNVIVNENATGYAVVIVDGKTYTVNNFVGGKGNVTVPGLTASDYTVVATFTSTSTDYGGSENSTVFNVAKKVSEVNITISDDKLGDDTIITVSIPGATGNVTVIVNGKEENITLDGDGNATYTIEDIDAGDYNVVVIYPGDKEHAFAYATDSFTVPKLESEVKVTADSEVKVGVETTITVDVTAGATGTVIVNVNGTEYAIDLAETNTLAVAFDKAGEYTIVASYLGDDEYNVSESNVATVVVSDKEAANISVDVVSKDSLVVGDEIEIIVTADTNAELIVMVNGEEVSPVPANGIVGASSGNALKASSEKLYRYTADKAGIYNVTVLAKENDEFASEVYSEVFLVAKKDAELNIAPISGAKVGDKVAIKVDKDTDGDLTIKVNDVAVTGEYEITKAGSYTIVVESAETENYTSGFATFTFDVAEDPVVPKQEAKVSIDTPTDAEAGDNVSVTVSIQDATGDVVVIIDGKVNTATLDKGSATVPMNNVAAGNHSVVVIYAGDDNYNGTYEATTFNVAEIPVEPETNMTVIVDGKEYNAEIVNGTPTVTTDPVEVDNNITVVVDGVSYPAVVVDGKVVIDTNATEPNNNVTVVVDGVSYPAVVVDGKVVIDTNATAPEKEISNASVTVPENIKSGESGSVDVSIPGATGNVSVIVDGVETVVPLDGNGAASVALDNVSAGLHSVVVVYPGDETHAPTYAASSFRTEEVAPVIPVISEFTEITIGDDFTVSVVLKDETGKVIANAPIAYSVNGVAKTTVTDKDGKFSIKGESGAVIAIGFAGNETVIGINTTLTLNAAVVPSVVKVESRFNISDRVITINGYAVDTDAGEEGIYYATTLLDASGKPIANAYIEFAVNNKIYNRTTYENGSFKEYKLNMKTAGRYTMAFNFAGDDNYTNAFACVCVDLDKKPIKIKASAKSYKASVKTKKYTVTLSTIVGSSHDGKVHLKSGMKVTLTVNGKTYTGKTNANGKVTFKITNLNKKGKYTADISFKGDKTYDEANKSVKLTIK